MPDPDEDLHGPPHDHPPLPVYLPEEHPVTVIHRAAGIEDPMARAAELTRHLAVAQAWVEWGSRQRDLAVLQVRDGGASYEELARGLSVSKSRAQQLCRRLEEQRPTATTPWRREVHEPISPEVAAVRAQHDGER